MLPHPLISFVIQRYYENNPRFNGACWRDNLPNKQNDGSYVKNLDEYIGINTYWIALESNSNIVAHLDSSQVEHISKERNKILCSKNLTKKIIEWKHTIQ